MGIIKNHKAISKKVNKIREFEYEFHKQFIKKTIKCFEDLHNDSKENYEFKFKIETTDYIDMFNLVVYITSIIPKEKMNSLMKLLYEDVGYMKINKEVKVIDVMGVKGRKILINSMNRMPIALRLSIIYTCNNAKYLYTNLFGEIIEQGGA